MSISRNLLAATVISFGIAGAPAALIQSASAQQSDQQFSSKTVESFAAAADRVSILNQTYAPRMEAAETEAQRAKIREEASTKMIEAVRDEGLTVKQYNEIIRASQQDEQLKREIDDLRGAR